MAKLEIAYSFMLKYFKITMWADINSHWHSILGTREFPFTYQLPVDLPESLEDSRYATITYTVKRFPFHIKLLQYHSVRFRAVDCLVL